MAEQLVAFKSMADFERAVRAIKGWERTQPQSKFANGGNRYRDEVQWFPFRNDYAGTIPGRSVMRITGATTFSSEVGGGDDQPILTCDQPNTTFYRQYAVCEANDVAQGDYGMCALSGLLEVAYDSGTPAQDEGWGPKPSQWTISKNYPSNSLVEAVTDSTNKYALVNFGPINKFVGKANAAIAADATNGVVKVCQGAGGSETAITSMTLSSVTNRCGYSLLTDDIVYVEYFEGVPYIVNARMKAKWISFTLAATLSTSDASKSSTTVSDFWQGYDPGGTVTIYNQPASSGYIFSGASGAKGLACLDDIDDKYRIVQMECP